MHKPLHSLAFAVGFFCFLGLVGYLFPSGGILLGKDRVLKFPSPRTLFSLPAPKADISDVLQAANKADTLFRIDDPGEAMDTAASNSRSVTLNSSIQHRNAKALQKFYEALRSQKEYPSLIRVLHYGDSQIEGDRISDYLRLRLQGQFGGSGPGLISFMPLTTSPTNYVAAGPGWDRYSLFTVKDTRVPHNSYGVLASFCRYMPYRKHGDSSAVRTADLQIATTDATGGNMPEYTKVKLFYGGARAKTWCEFYDGPALVSADSLDRWGTCRIKEYPVLQGSNVHTFKFRGTDSPDFYALSLESETGIMVDNIAMRGSSGTFFHQIDNSQLKQFYDHLNVKLVILQFGGNTLPAIEDSVMARNYAEYMEYQITLVKKLAPGASILFIGPSDMSVKDGTGYVTHPFLEVMRDHLKRAVLDAGCAYFDLYDVMGGRNSMPAWVDENLAGKDYTHFSPRGARKIGSLLYAALISDYNDYIRELK